MKRRTYKGFSWLSTTSSPTNWIIAAWHSPHSLTWRWVLAWHKWEMGADRFVWRGLVNGFRNMNGTGQWWVTFPWIGRLHWSWQQPLWYRDLYWRMRDEQGRESELAYLQRMQEMAAGTEKTQTHDSSGSVH